ncbi:type II secretion system F family protein [Kribbella deserti]|uniref:Type II secretion system F family protein n=1 Tax=Kribbella deserti TaxID=1926257 RepID=A0ABV6QSP1_9ACTN
MTIQFGGFAAAVLVGVAVALALPASARGIRRLRPRQVPTLRFTLRSRRTVVAAVMLVLVVGSLLGAQVLVSLMTVSVLVGTALLLRAKGRARAAADGRRGQVIEACTILAADLRAGRTPRDAMEGAATVCPELRPAAAAARLGGDVSEVLEFAARSPGCGGLRALAAAWRVSDRSGAALAGIAERLALSLRTDEAVRKQVTAGLGGTRATARLLAALPVLATFLGYAVGAAPLTFLTNTPIGWACLTLGLALGVLGLFWVERMATKCESTQ